MSSVVTISQPRSRDNETSSDTQVVIDPDADPDALEVRVEFDPPNQEDDNDPERTNKARNSSLAKLQGLGSRERSKSGESRNTSRSSSSSRRKLATAQAIIRRNPKNGPDAVIVLKEEKV
jgi:hypothetical protein